MASGGAHVHVIAKDKTSENHVKVTTTSSLPPLQDGHIRARSLLIGLTSNNMAYATQGTRMHWWDAFPVPADLPSPFNEVERYGIVPCWGYGEVLESEIAGIDAGRLLWGFWPSSELPVDLKLTPAGVAGHFVEVSEHRSQIMNMYQRYMLTESDVDVSSLRDGEPFDRLARTANARAVWEGGYLINKAIFGQPPIHPLGSGAWSEERADLSSTVVISLSASGRTARSFTDNVFHHRKADTGPLALLAITSNFNAAVFRQPPIPTEIVSYKDMTAASTFSWIAKHKPQKIVVVDFGGRDNAFDTLFGALETALADVEVMAIGVGAEAKAHSAEDVGKFFQRNALPNRETMNTTGIRDAMMATLGEAEYFQGLEKAWQGFLERGSLSDQTLEVGNGIAGHGGFEQGWSDLAAGCLPTDVAAKVYQL